MQRRLTLGDAGSGPRRVDGRGLRLDNMLEALRKQLHRLWQDARHGPVRPPVASGWEGSLDKNSCRAAARRHHEPLIYPSGSRGACPRSISMLSSASPILPSLPCEPSVAKFGYPRGGDWQTSGGSLPAGYVSVMLLPPYRLALHAVRATVHAVPVRPIRSQSNIQPYSRPVRCILSVRIHDACAPARGKFIGVTHSSAGTIGLPSLPGLTLIDPPKGALTRKAFCLSRDGGERSLTLHALCFAGCKFPLCPFFLLSGFWVFQDRVS